MLQRRTVLAMAALPALSACGFTLRKAPDFGFDSIHIAMPSSSSLALELRRQLEATDRVRVITDATQRNEAEVILHSAGEQRERTVLSMTSAGQVREYQLRLSLSFRANAPDGRELIPATQLARQMDQSYSESDALSKEQERELLYDSMQSDLVQQVMQRLARIER